MKVVEISGMDECFRDQEAKHYQYNGDWTTSSTDPIAVLHTSGSTGLPKPIVITHEHMAAVDNYHFIPTADGQELSVFMAANKRVISFFPPFHVRFQFFRLFVVQVNPKIKADAS